LTVSLHNLLSSISHQVHEAKDLDQALRIIVARIKQALKVDVCSIYLVDEKTDELLLMASDGLLSEAIGSVRIRFNKGIVGLVAERSEAINLANAQNHPRFHYFSETGEEIFRAFLGVPIIHQGNLIGVLVLQQSKAHRFQEDIVTAITTFSVQIASAICHVKNIDIVTSRNHKQHLRLKLPLKGIPGAAGIGIGTAVVIHLDNNIETIHDNKDIDITSEQQRFANAVAAVKSDINHLLESSATVLPVTFTALFEAYLMMLDSDSLIGATSRIISSGNWAPGALRQVIQEHIHAFNDMDDPYLQQRAEDVRDLGNRILQHLIQDLKEAKIYPEKVILVGEEISASMLAEVPKEQLAGVIALKGSSTSHAAILASALGVPTILGIDDLPISLVNGLTIIVDGYSGEVYINPEADIIKEFKSLQNEDLLLSNKLLEFRNLPSQTKDGVHIPLYASTGLISDIPPALNYGAEGVGLYRTELSFFEREFFPGEHEQQAIYHKVLKSFSPSPVIMRTLDIGGDKVLPYFPIAEENPFLGWRGIRISLDHPELFLMQVRAMMRANTGLNNLKILLPMISDLSEYNHAMKLINQAYKEITEEGHNMPFPEIGAMIEVPSIIYQMDALSKRVDFFSIGSNDLTQYLLAVDRNNARVASLYDYLNPSVISAINTAVRQAKKNNKPISVCGEMTSDPMAVLILIGMGIDSLIMNASSMLRNKWLIQSFTKSQTEEIFNKVLTMEDSDSIKQYLTNVLEKSGLGGLVRAGN